MLLKPPELIEGIDKNVDAFELVPLTPFMDTLLILSLVAYARLHSKLQAAS